MKLRSKLIMASLVPLILALLMVSFIVIKMTQLQANNSSYVPVMVEVQKLNASLVNSEQTLSAYASSVSDGNKSAALTALAVSKKEIAKLSKMPLQSQHRMTLEKIQKKTNVLTEAAKKAFNSGDASEVKRQSLRIRGILNDVYLLDYRTTQYYHQLTSQLKANIQFVITSAIIGSIVLIILALGFGLWMALQLASRIQRLADNAKAVASGNLNIEIVETRGGDEVAELQSAFKEMIYNLKDIMKRISVASNELGSFAEDVSSQNRVLKEMSQQIAVSTDEMAIGAQSISAELLDAKESVEHMNDAFEESLVEVNRASSASLETVESIKDGHQAIDKQKDYLMESVKNSEQMGVSMKNFSQQTKEIEKMAQLVSEISDETNLLALNASIEAARAGEYGKGFAVVASEIRKLADGSHQATKQIFDLIQKVNEGQNVVLKTIEVSMQGVKQQESAMADTTKAFNAIDTQVQSIDTRIKFLAERMAGSREQANRFSTVIENVSSVTEESAAGSEEISASTIEQLDAIGKMLENVEELNHTANRLKEGMQRFSKDEELEG